MFTVSGISKVNVPVAFPNVWSPEIVDVIYSYITLHHVTVLCVSVPSVDSE